MNKGANQLLERRRARGFFGKEREENKMSFISFNKLTDIDTYYIPYDYESSIADDVAVYAMENGVNPETAIDKFRDEITGKDNGSYFCSIFEAELALVGNSDVICNAQEAGYLDNVDLSDPDSIDIRLREYLLDYHKEEILELASRE